MPILTFGYKYLGLCWPTQWTEKIYFKLSSKKRCLFKAIVLRIVREEVNFFQKTCLPVHISVLISVTPLAYLRSVIF